MLLKMVLYQPFHQRPEKDYHWIHYFLFVTFHYKNNTMDHENKLEELNREALQKLEEYMKEKASEGDNHDKVHSAKDEWQVAWNKLMETLLVLEKLEI